MAAAVAVDEANPALDTAAAFLRALGEAAVEVPGQPAAEVARMGDAWANHLLIGRPSPAAPDAAQAQELQQRDWAGAREFAARVLRQQASRVSESFKNLREALAAVLRGMDAAVHLDAAHDARVNGNLERMRAALQSGQPELIRREVLSAVEGIATALQERRAHNEQQATELGSRVRQMHEELSEARRESGTDALTQLANRRAFDAALDQALLHAHASGTPALLLLLDLDHFKSVNDRFGHAAGDSVLKRVADALARSYLRRSDLVARFGGEEFAVLLTDVAPAGVMGLAERSLRAVRAVQFDDVEDGLRATISVGVAPIEPHDTTSSWIERADRALYAAKREGRDRAVLGRP